MLLNYFKITSRIFKRKKLSTLINIVGLGIGLAFFVLLVAYVRDELSFDRFHAKGDRIYVLTNEFRGRFVGGFRPFYRLFGSFRACSCECGKKDQGDRHP